MVKSYFFFKIVLLFACLLTTQVNHAAAETLECPPSISTREVLDKVAPPIWNVDIDVFTRHLVGATFFDGPPASNNSIVPTKDSASSSGNRIASWDLKTSDAPIWLSCRYLDTGISLSRQLPKTYKECRIFYGPGGRLDAIKCH
jgi:hypothetical protein